MSRQSRLEKGRMLTGQEYRNFNTENSVEYKKAYEEDRLLVDDHGGILHWFEDEFHPALVGKIY
jgi:hypothetical protein